VSKLTIPVRDTDAGRSVMANEKQVEIPMPTWTDPTSIVVFLTAAISVANGIIVVLHPGFVIPPIVQALVPAVSWVIAGGVIAFNVIRHLKATAAALSR
jgi:hypothetical protein